MAEDTEKYNVLVVDDTPENIDLLVAILKDDYKVKAARSGEIALKIINSNTPPDLVLLDVMMPGMDGYEVCRRMKDDHTTKEIPVIFITAKISMEDELYGLELGAVDYITKPISPPIVQSRVKTHLALYSQKRELYKLVVKQTNQLRVNQQLIIRRLGRAAEYKDNETGDHIIRMSMYAKILAKAAGLSEQASDELMWAAPLHDLGKIGIPDKILQKRGKLDKEEFDLMKGHCEIGAEILGDTRSELLTMAKTIALTHHEKWDGSGYPKGLKGEEIPKISRIVAIADVFDALTSERPYKKAWTNEDAIDLLKKEAGKHFDPALVALFVQELPTIIRTKDEFNNNQLEVV